jgi:malate dehydrogenase
MSLNRNKITIVGAGNVGASCASWIIERNLADVVLLDIPETKNMPKGKALDMLQMSPISNTHCKIIGTTNYELTASSDICVITAGVPRKPGMSREDLVATNQGIVQTVVKNLTQYSPQTILIIVTNPLDSMCYVALKASNFPKNRVIGQAGVLDSARMRTFISQELGISVENIHASVIGGHGDEMVPLIRYSTICGLPLSHFLSKEKINEIVDRTRKGGSELVNLLGISAWYAPGAAAGFMVEAILKDKKIILPCSAFLEGEYGLSNLYFGVLGILGNHGLEKIIDIPLNEEEQQLLKKSAGLIQETMKSLK